MTPARGRMGEAQRIVLFAITAKGELHPADFAEVYLLRRPERAQIADLDRVARRWVEDMLRALWRRGLVVPKGAAWRSTIHSKKKKGKAA